MFSTENIVTESAIDAFLSVMVKKGLDETPRELEFSGHQISFHGKAARNDGIPEDDLQCAKRTLLHHLHDTFCPAGRNDKYSTINVVQVS